MFKLTIIERRKVNLITVMYDDIVYCNKTDKYKFNEFEELSLNYNDKVLHYDLKSKKKRSILIKDLNESDYIEYNDKIYLVMHKL